MSFLNSVLSSINKDGTAQPTRPSIPAAKPRPAQSSNQAANGAQSAQSNGQGTLKRKADQQGGSQTLKVPKTSTNTLSASPSRSNTTSPAPRLGVPPPRPQEPYKGTSRPNAQIATGSSKPVASKPVTNTTETSTAKPVVAPKKSGYLATLEKAKAAQALAQQKGMGQIKHIKVEKKHLSRKEKERLAAEAAAAQKDPKLKTKLQPAGKSRDGTPVNGKAQESKKKIETGYKGTMRPAAPAQPAYKGTMRPGGPAKPTNNSQKPRPGDSSRYRYAEDYSDEEDEEGDEDDYDSGSSDMEAGLMDIDQEEMMSTKMAKKEDEEALREEEELKRQKLERKRRLQALSAAAAKKKKVY